MNKTMLQLLNSGAARTSIWGNVATAAGWFLMSVRLKTWGNNLKARGIKMRYGHVHHKSHFNY